MALITCQNVDCDLAGVEVDAPPHVHVGGLLAIAPSWVCTSCGWQMMTIPDRPVHVRLTVRETVLIGDLLRRLEQGAEDPVLSAEAAEILERLRRRAAPHAPGA